MLRFVEHRVGDPRLISLIRRWLKASVLEDGESYPSEQGTPQGGSISVLLSNLYLHYVLDLWFERVVKPRLRGEAYLVRYIDDFVLCFQYREDALRVQEALSKRLGKFSLTLESSKTKLVEFGRFAQRHAGKCGRRRPETIYFLGFTLYCTRNQKGNFRVGLRTEKTRLRRALMHMQDQMRRMRHLPIREAVLAQDAEQPELEGCDLAEALSSDQGAVSAVATKAVSPLCGAASYCRAVKHLLTSAVREIRTLRSVGAGGG